MKLTFDQAVKLKKGDKLEGSVVKKTAFIHNGDGFIVYLENGRKLGFGYIPRNVLGVEQYGK